MKKQLRFFLSKEDESLIVDLLENQGAMKEEKSSFQWIFRFEEAFIQFLRCQISPDYVTLGRVAIMTTNEMNGKKSAEATFRKLERMIKQTFVNDLSVKNINTEGSESQIKNIWVGVGMKNVISLNPTYMLKQSANGFIVYELKS